MTGEASYETRWSECRPSSWPVRNERRHCAIAKFNAEVLSLLTDITSRLERIEDNLSPAPINHPPGLMDSGAIGCQYRNGLIDVLEDRLSRMEKLLLRTPLPDFEELDRKIHAFLHETQAEPEREGSPAMSATLSTSSTTSSHEALEKCNDIITELHAEEYFGILTADIGTQCGEQVDFAACRSSHEQELPRDPWRVNADIRVLQEVRSIDGRYILQPGELYVFLGLEDDAAELEYAYDDWKVRLQVKESDLSLFSLCSEHANCP